MKFVLAGYGSRGDVEPCAAVGLELLRRGHDVRMAVPPNMRGFVESAGLDSVAYGPDSQALPHNQGFVRSLAVRLQNPISLLPEVIERVTRVCAEKSATLTVLTKGADLLVAGITEQGLAANVAELHRIPLAALHFFPAQLLSLGWLHAHITKEAENAQRRALGLPKATDPPTRAAVAPRLLEIQAYDELCMPELAAEWADCGARRPFVGALTLELPTDGDDEVMLWIAAGTPPIYFGLGSTPVSSPAETVAMISAACRQLGERALICSGPNDFSDVPQDSHVMVVGEVNHAAVFPACRAVVHHGGAGTTAAVLRAGIPMLILWLWLDQPAWAAAVKQLKVGLERPFSSTTQGSLVADLGSLLSPHYMTRAREVAALMIKPAESVASAADLLEDAAHRKRFD